ncbi:50S ribosomal protein L1, partial [Acidithiobacillus ferrooxidans]|nr:50S ribosomal protein L1 [Acidithiobacillus ferrooxidans]
MATKSKRTLAIRAMVDRNNRYAIEEALELVKKMATTKFDESVDVAVGLGIDPRKSDQVVRGAVVLPHGTGKQMRV